MRTFVGPLLAEFDPRHRGRFGGHRPGLFILLMLLVAAIIVLAIFLYRARSGPSPAAVPGTPPATPAARAEAILSERFARGEVSVDEFVATRSALRGEWVAAPTAAAPPAPAPTAPAPPAPEG